MIFHGRNNIMCSTDCKYKTVATLYTLETWFVSCIYTMNTGDNKDNNSNNINNNNNNNMCLLTSGSAAQIPIKTQHKNTKHKNDVNTRSNNIESNNLIINSMENTGL